MSRESQNAQEDGVRMGILEVSRLHKCYGEKIIIKELSINVEQGEILCLLGPNGAGKSTTINILTGLLGLNSGEVKYKGQDIKTCLKFYKQHLGVVPQDLAIYEELSAENNVSFFGALYGLKKDELKKSVEDALKKVGLYESRKDVAGTFSGGMKRRLNIACAIVHMPELLIMDEPTVGIDPQSRNHILDMIKELRNDGMTIIYTTHYMEEVEEIGSRILIMDQGCIIAEGTNESLKDEYIKARQYIIQIKDRGTLSNEDFYKVQGVTAVKDKEEDIIITTQKDFENVDKIVETVMKGGAKMANLFCRNSSLETVFLELTGKNLRD